MATLYLESSAVVGWLVGEPRSQEVAQQLESAESVATSALTFAEVDRAIARRAGSGELAHPDELTLRGVLARERRRWLIMAVTETVLERASRTFPVEPVGTLDAIHLATALILVEALPGIRMLTFDRKIAENATAMGLI
ncbi:MAG TPA: type II toxin-antitoxin system VapC family toxin [Candidatus Sulfotelmatobacter sp.]|jgi:predicted nucleic acid-binding protein|nr:type II toxin-antitoxin system VapC family toxin [Candidatus Sulfotelmatobacter sp.]